MRTAVVVFVQIVISLIVTASVMPLILLATPAARTNGRFGVLLMAGVVLVSFTLVSLAWPRRLG